MSSLIPDPRKDITPLAHCAGSLAVDMPRDWLFKESYTLLSPDGQANLIVSTEPLDPTIDAEQYATVQGDLLTTEFPGYQHIAFEDIDVPGIPGPVFYREFSWTPPDGQPVTQMQIYAVAAGGRGITATGTATSEQFSRYRAALYQQISSLQYSNSRRFVSPASTPTWS